MVESRTTDSHAKAIRVMVIEDNHETNALICQYVKASPGLELAGAAFDGAEALELLQRTEVDVVTLDIVMPRMDGFGFLRRRQQLPAEKRPHVVVLTALKREDFIERALSYDVDYYIVKPFAQDELCEHIKDAARIKLVRQPSARIANRPWTRPELSPEEKVSSLLLSVGIPAHIKGYQFLRDAVRLVMGDRDIINRITKELYPAIALGANTSPSKVERAIRHAIEVAWSRGRIEVLNRELGASIFAANDKPTNGEFIALIADRMGTDGCDWEAPNEMAKPGQGLL